MLQVATAITWMPVTAHARSAVVSMLLVMLAPRPALENKYKCLNLFFKLNLILNKFSRYNILSLRCNLKMLNRVVILFKVCTTCASGYFASTEAEVTAGKAACQACNTGCEICSPDAGTCTTCMYGADGTRMTAVTTGTGAGSCTSGTGFLQIEEM